MHYVILRDDDTNALTPAGCLEDLYRPFLERGLPVNLATIPRVRTDCVRPDGELEGFLLGKAPGQAEKVALSENVELVEYLHANPGFRIVQHGYDHSPSEFASRDARDIQARLERGTAELALAGFPAPRAFVAPYDQFSAASLRQIAKRFKVFSTGWFNFQRVPLRWWPRYLGKKLAEADHWRANGTTFLTHPGCLLSYQRPYVKMLENVQGAVESQTLTVLVTHWWEYFRGGVPDQPLINILHETADYLASDPDIQVIAFDDLADGKIPIR